MIILDANILIRAVLGRRVRQLLEAYSKRGVRFFAPVEAYTDAQRHLPEVLEKFGKDAGTVPAELLYLQSMIAPLETESYLSFEDEARILLRGCDEEDWPILAAALLLACPIWTEDTDFFGIGVAVWNTARVEIFLKAQAESLESEEE